MKTYQPTQKEVKRNWHLVDVGGKILGRVATQIAGYLTGKIKANYSPHMDSGDFVVVINAQKVAVSGKKEVQKLYRKHSGYPGGFRETTFKKLNTEKPVEIIRHAVAGMLPDNRLKKDRLARLKIFAGEKHSFEDKFKKQ